MHKSRTLLLIGFKGCGKTYFGERLAKKYTLSWVDSDRCIESFYQKTYGQSLQCFEIYRELGAMAFRELEKQVFFKIPWEMTQICSTGGGSVHNEEIVFYLSQKGPLVYLKTPLSVLKTRIDPQKTTIFKDESLLEKSYNERVVVYERYADYVIDCYQSEDNIFSQLIEIYKKEINQ